MILVVVESEATPVAVAVVVVAVFALFVVDYRDTYTRRSLAYVRALKPAHFRYSEREG